MLNYNGESNKLKLPISSLVEVFKVAQTKLVLTLHEFLDKQIRDVGIVTYRNNGVSLRVSTTSGEQPQAQGHCWKDCGWT